MGLQCLFARIKNMEDIIMYKILAFENGQPIILFLDSRKVYMYTANSGRIISKGLLFDDVKKDFDIYSCKEQYIYYISTDNRIKLAKLNRDRFTEFLSIPMEDKEQNVEIVNVSPLMCQNELYIFYCNHNHIDGKYEIYYILSSSPNKSCLIERNIDTNKGFDVFKADNKLGLVLNDNYSLSQNIEELKKTLSEKISQLIDTQRQLYEKNNEIITLKSTQKHITAQYNELAEYAGKLQDELRKIRYT